MPPELLTIQKRQDLIEEDKLFLNNPFKSLTREGPKILVAELKGLLIENLVHKLLLSPTLLPIINILKKIN